MRALTSTLATALVLALSSGCGDDAAADEPLTELILLVDTDLPVPSIVDSIRIETVEPGGMQRSTTAMLRGPGADALPGSLALLHAGGPLGPVRVKAVALQGETIIVTQDLEVSFIKGRSVSVTLELLASCVSVSCDQGQTCGRDGCRPVAVADGELSDYDSLPDALGTVEFDAAGLDLPDAGTDSGTPTTVLNTACSDSPCDPLTVCTPVGEDQRECGACPAGYDGDGVDGCTDVDECATDNGGCSAAVTCRNNVGAPVSCGACPIGFDDVTGDGSECVDIDECATDNGGCGATEYWDCANNEGALPTCTDVDECATDNGGCTATFTTCINNPGGDPTCRDVDECAVNNGECGDPALFTCANNPTAEPTCADIDQCAFNNGGCGPAVFYTCTHVSGEVPTCADINECDVSFGGCDVTFETCANNVGAAATCTDIDECTISFGGCDVSFETCSDNVGAIATCTDIDECAINNGGCHADANCADRTKDVPVCTCKGGFTGDGQDCADTNECASDNGGCGTQECFNTPGSSFCSPLAGIAAGSEHTCGLLSDGGVRCWGQNGRRQLGLGLDLGFTLSSASKDIPGLTTAVELAAGEHHTCARLGDGRVLCWGFNDYGQIGNGFSDANVDAPAEVVGIGAGAPGAVAITAGTNHTCAILDDDTVACWGRNNRGQLGDQSVVERPTPVQVLGYPTTCLYAGNTHQCSTTYSAPTTLRGVRAITAGHEHTCALGSTVTDTGGDPLTDPDLVRCWGNGGSTRLGSGDGTQRTAAARPVKLLLNDFAAQDVRSLAVGADFGCMLLETGDVRCWGYGAYGQLGRPTGASTNEGDPVAVIGVSGATELSLGYDYGCALQDDQQMLCWGRNNSGQLGDGRDIADGYSAGAIAPTVLGPVLAIYAGRQSTFALAQDGRLYGWGRNSGELLGIGHSTHTSTPTRIGRVREVVAHSNGEAFSCAVDTAGTVTCWGRNDERQIVEQSPRFRGAPTDVAGLGAATKVVTGRNHTCALLQDGTVHCWGDNGYGKVSAAPSSPVFSPSPIAGLSGPAIDLSAGYHFTCAVIEGGTVQCWGRNQAGQLGDPNDLSNSAVPVTIPGISDATAVSSGRRHACAVLASRRLTCWGYSQFGETGTTRSAAPYAQEPTDTLLDSVIQVAAFDSATCALIDAGSSSFTEGVWCWGRNNVGQLGTTGSGPTPVPTGATGTRLSSSGGGGGIDQGYMCLVQADGGLQCWGANARGQLGDGTNQNRFAPVDVQGLPSPVDSVSTGREHTCAALTDGTMICWGRNNERQCGDGTTMERWEPTALNGIF